MPWGAFARMEEEDLRAVYRYLTNLDPIEHHVGPSIQEKNHMSRTTFLAAGTVAGAAVNILDGTLYAVLLGQDTAIVMERLGLTAPGTAGMILYTVLGFLIGFVGVWLYLGVRARFGPGPRSAVKTGVAVWAVAYLAPFLDLTIEGVFTPRMFWIAAGYTLLSTPLALLAGAWAYREAEAPGSHAEAEPETASMR